MKGRTSTPSLSRLLVDDPSAFYLELPRDLGLDWVLGLTLPPGPRPVLVMAEEVRTGTDEALDALAARLCGRQVAYLRLPPRLLARLAPRVARLAEMLSDGAA